MRVNTRVKHKMRVNSRMVVRGHKKPRRSGAPLVSQLRNDHQKIFRCFLHVARSGM